MRHRRSTVVGPVLMVTLLAMVSACGVPLEDSPRAIAQTSTTQSTVPPTEPGNKGPKLTVYYFLDDRLTPTMVDVTNDPTPKGAVAAVLKAPPSPFLSRIPANTQLLGFTIADRTATIELSEDIGDVEAEFQKSAYAQLVFTALESGEASRVSFEVAGKMVNVATDNGNLPVLTAADYEESFRPTA